MQRLTTNVFHKNELTVSAATNQQRSTTKAKINLTDVKLINASNTLLRIASDRWGTSGKNGGDVNFTTNQQSLNGNIEVAKSSSLDFTIKNSSKLTGAINTADSGSTINISLDSTSEWDVTKDSYIKWTNW
ncbi:hypothetical protein ACYATM_05875 [Lactobacillaceae bacterium Scapto_B20]